ncbi:hypothetical protein [Acinetobacter rongchengensis]|uniref:Uncharacterized protein n=1 Tax=Acinetobacter rongchengensis TaxID=2419601 RepID=A0A3A8EN57_9GAMM|nr:hypothetical protein [Acinetobacter rongchengensis]RKG31404.1 hypothetical protein D7V20_18660 [Acinetobacter rongchengensis]
MTFDEWYKNVNLQGLSIEDVAKMAFEVGQHSQIQVDHFLSIGNTPQITAEDYQEWKKGKTDFEVLESYYDSIAYFFQKNGDEESREYMKLISEYTGYYIADIKGDFYQIDFFEINEVYEGFKKIYRSTTSYKQLSELQTDEVIFLRAKDNYGFQNEIVESHFTVWISMQFEILKLKNALNEKEESNSYLSKLLAEQ